MTTRKYIDKNKNTWEWEETSSVKEALDNYWNVVKNNQQNKKGEQINGTV